MDNVGCVHQIPPENDVENVGQHPSPTFSDLFPNMEEVTRNYFDILPREVQTLIFEIKSAIVIQKWWKKMYCKIRAKLECLALGVV